MKKKEENLNRNVSQKRLNFTTVKNLIFHILRQFDDPYYGGFAAQIAYFFFMASIPTILLVSQLLGLFNVSLDYIRELIEQYVDPSIVSIIENLLSGGGSTNITNVIMVLVVLWSASSLEYSLARLNSHILTEGRYKFSFVNERLKAIPIAVVSVVTIAFGLIAFMIGDTIFETIILSHIRVSFVVKILLQLRLPILVVLFFMMVLINYYILPRVRVPLRSVIPGAVLATFGMTVATSIYGFYLSNFAHYDLIYGSFAMIIVMILWFYIISWVLCLGMMFNKAWDDVFELGRLSVDKMHTKDGSRLLQPGLEYYEDNKVMFTMMYENPYVDSDSLAVYISRKFDPGYEEKYQEAKAEYFERHKKNESDEISQDDYKEVDSQASDRVATENIQ